MSHLSNFPVSVPSFLCYSMTFLPPQGDQRWCYHALSIPAALPDPLAAFFYYNPTHTLTSSLQVRVQRFNPYPSTPFLIPIPIILFFPRSCRMGSFVLSFSLDHVWESGYYNGSTVGLFPSREVSGSCRWRRERLGWEGCADTCDTFLPWLGPLNSAVSAVRKLGRLTVSGFCVAFLCTKVITDLFSSKTNAAHVCCQKIEP